MTDAAPASARWDMPSLVAASIAALLLIGAGFIARDGSQLASTPRLALYVVLPALIGACGLAVVLLRRSAAILYLVYLGAFAVALVIAEIVLAREDAAAERAARDAVRDAPAAAAGGLTPQLCTASVSIADPPYRLNGTLVLPLGGIAHAKLAANPPHVADERGFNNPAGLWSRAPVEILAVGDSFTYGADVPFGQGFVDVIRARVPLTVNLGCGGNGPYSALAALAEHGPELKPKLVLWGFYEGNDLTKDVYLEAGSKLLTSYLQPEFRQGLDSGSQPAVDRAMREHLDAQLGRQAELTRRALPQPAGANWRGIVTLNALRTRLGLRHAVRADALAQFDIVLARAKAVAASWGGRIALVYLPAETRYASAFGKADARGYAAKVRAVIARNGLPLIDVAAHFDALKEPRGLYRGHFTVEGYAKTGTLILDELVRAKLLPPAR